jgi:cobalt-zinc-cadmium resistance protein CzcA
MLPLERVKVCNRRPSASAAMGRRRTTVQANVRGRDVASYVAEAKAKITGQVKLPEGYTVEWGGQFENMERANRKLMFVVPLALGLIFVLLFFSLKSLLDVLIVATLRSWSAACWRCGCATCRSP